MCNPHGQLNGGIGTGQKLVHGFTVKLQDALGVPLQKHCSEIDTFFVKQAMIEFISIRPSGSVLVNRI